MYSTLKRKTTVVSSAKMMRVEVGFMCTPGRVERMVRKALQRVMGSVA